MESSKLSIVFACLVLHSALAQPPTYRQESSQKVQLEDIEQDSLKNAQPPVSQVQSVPQYTAQYPGQNSQLVYSVPAQQSPNVAPGQTATQQAASYPLYAIPTQTGGGALPGQQQHFIYYMQPPQYTTYDVPFFGGAYSFVPQTAQTVLPANLNVNDLYKTLQQQTTQTSGKNGAPVKAAAPQQVPTNYFYSPLPQAYFSPVHLPQVPVSNTPQYVAYNSFYPVQTAQKSVYSSGVKSTTVAPAKNTESSYRFDFNNSPDFAKVRVTG